MCEQFNESAFHESDIMFWSNQISKQVYYTYLALEYSCEYKEKARILWDKWQEYILTLPIATSTDGFIIDQSVSYFYDFERFNRSKRDYLATDRNINAFNNLINVTKHLIENILVTVTNAVTNFDSNPKAWIGFNYPTQLEALLLCINYAKRKVNCEIFCDKTTMRFWNTVVKDNLFIAIHLLDPSEVDLITYGYKIGCKLDKLWKQEDCKNYEKDSIKQLKNVDKYFRTIKCESARNQVRSILLPLLLTVFMRYVQRALRDETYLYCKTRHRCCPGLNECCTNFSEIIGFISKEANKCDKWPATPHYKCCN